MEKIDIIFIIIGIILILFFFSSGIYCLYIERDLVSGIICFILSIIFYDVLRQVNKWNKILIMKEDK